MRFVLPFIAALCATSAQAATCGGSFASFVDGLKQEAIASGHDRATVDQFFANVSQDDAVIRADRRQGVFQKDFIDFSRSLI